ncbi:zinc finger MYM-type protein 1-like [Anoplophora glabripennis]|uniref:zinc finger MYM-type protein 1-like n=1 Tax=Anoplophora glabripennis TaxID=217634 RepID=UPI000C791553|nr:zinc finger MYM-type protein 1-like [Anoplophora glabripennis]
MEKMGRAKDKVYVRKFRNEWYSEYKWLCGSIYLNKLFCMPCLIVSVKSSVWNKGGFNNFGNVTRGCRNHEGSLEHIRCALMFAELRKNLSTIEDDLTDNSRLYIKQFNDNVLLNRRFMQLPIRAVIYLGRQELAFWGHNESECSDNRGNFMELLDMFISISPADIQEHYKKISSVFSANSKTIANELIDCISDYIDQYVDKEIEECNYFSIQVDDSTDIVQKPQCNIIIRYVNRAGKLVERFLGFFNVSSDRTADALFNLVTKRIEKYDYRSKLVGQCFDWASVMAGQVNDLQSKMKNEAPQAVFVHCAAHRLNLVLQQSCNNILKCRIFFANVTGFPSFFHHFAKRTHIANTIIKRRIPTSVLTCWTSNSNIVKVINNEWDSIKEVFIEIINDITSDQTSVRQSTAILNLFNDFEFALLIGIFSEIFSITDILFDMLQKHSLNINYGMSQTQIKNTQELLNEKRNEKNFKEIFELGSIKVPIPVNYRDGQKTLTADEIFEKYKILYYEILDTISGQIDVQFKDLDKIHFITLMDTTRFEEYSKNFPTEALNNLNNCFPNIFSDLPRLKKELYFIYNDEKYRNIELDQILEVVDILYENRDILKEAYKLFCLIVTIPSTSISVERSFSCLKRTKTYLHNSMTEDNVTNLAKISIEKELLNELIITEPFYDDIIDKFAALPDRRMHLIFKK